MGTETKNSLTEAALSPPGFLSSIKTAPKHTCYRHLRDGVWEGAMVDELKDVQLVLSPAVQARVRQLTSAIGQLPVELGRPLLVHAQNPRSAPSVSYSLLQQVSIKAQQLALSSQDQASLTLSTHNCYIRRSRVPTADHSSTASLAQGSSLYVSPAASTNDKMASIRRDLQDRADRQAYNRMIASASGPGGHSRLLLKSRSPGTLVYSKQDAWASEDWDQTRREVSALLNVLVSMLAVAFAAWWLFANHTPAQVRQLQKEGFPSCVCNADTLYRKYWRLYSLPF